MNISTKQYAKALYDLTKEKNEKDINSIVLKFIIKKFSEIYNKENGIVECEVISAREIGDKQAEEIDSFIKNKYKAKKVSLTKKIDEKIKGGIILRVGDELIDGSVSKKLKKLSVLLKK